MRLDKYLWNLWIIARRQTKRFLKSGEVLINGVIETSPQTHIHEWDTLMVWAENIPVKFDIHLLIHKPQWYISSNVDEWPYRSYKDLLDDCPYAELVEIAGRLDVDTEGLLFCSSDGKLIHNIIHPHKKIEKEYFVRTKLPLTQQMLDTLRSWVTLEDFSKAKPAIAEQISDHGDNELRLTITEWKYHQVKRMLKGVGNEVTYLRRDRIGEWTLEGIEMGGWKYVEVEK